MFSTALRAVVVVLALSGRVFAQAAPTPDVGQMEKVVAEAVADRTFMGSVLVARGGDVLLSKGYGSANLEWNIPNSPTTKFRLGSITKQFTAASILLLAERGKLSLDDRLKAYLADGPASWDRITIRNLLNHTSGLPNFTAQSDYRQLQRSPTTASKILQTVRDLPLDFEAGEKMNYSNTGYIALGAIIEKVSGGTYADFVQQNLFGPLGMKDSGYDSNSAIIPQRASGYLPGANRAFVNAAYIDMTVPHAAGALYSTTEDLLRWEQALFGGRVLKPSSLEQMTTPFKNDYALGLVVHAVKNRKVIEHNGGIDGFNTHMAYYPESKVTVIVLGNVNGAAPGTIGAKLELLAHGDAPAPSPSQRQERTLPVATLQKYVGTYEAAPGTTLSIALVTDHLTGRIAGQQAFPLFAESETHFFLKAVDAQVDFTADANGVFSTATLHQNGRDVPWRRISDTVSEPAARKEMSLTAEKLSGLAGVYDLPVGSLTVVLAGDYLTAQLAGQPAFQIFAESDSRFFYKVVEATLDFERGTDGKATAVTLRQGPATLRGTRR